ncbi:MAG: RHS repeat-associated core domain-containing protein [Candidatus Omnitrophota bacterium]
MIKGNKYRVFLGFLISIIVLFSWPFLGFADEFEVKLEKGLNFISLPLNPSTTFIQNVFSSIEGKYTDVWSYDNVNSDDPWRHYHPDYVSFSDLFNIEFNKSYWVEVAQDCILITSGSPIGSDSFSLDLIPGWNTIGWPYLESQSVQTALYPLVLGTDYSSVFGFNSQTQSFQDYSLNQFSTFEPGGSYYIYALKNCVTQTLALPQVTIIEPISGVLLNTSNITAKGILNYEGVTVKVNNISAIVINKEFSADITLNEGQNIVTAEAVNQAGSSASDSISITVDTTPPEQPIVNLVTSPTNQNQQVITGVKQANTSLWINGKEIIPLNIETVWSHTVNLAEGQNTFSVTAKDEVGNESGAVEIVIVLDAVPPAAPVVYPATTPVNQTQQVISGTKEGDTSVWINSEEVVSLNEETTWIYTVNLIEGENIFTVTSKNSSGIESEAVAVTIILDTIAPTTPTLNPVTTPTNQVQQIISGTKESRTSVWMNEEEIVSLNNNTAWVYTVILKGGENTLNITLKDQAGNESSVVAKTITVDTVIPQLNLLAKTIDKNTVEITFSEIVKEAENSANYSVSPSAGSFSVTKSGNFTYQLTFSQPPAYNTLYIITAGSDITDSAGNPIDSLKNKATFEKKSTSKMYIYHNSRRLAMKENNKKYFYHLDHLGGTNIISNETGQQVKYLDYKPYGETKTETGTLNTTKKFTGKELDDSTGLYDYAARMYDPKLARFISADPIEYNDGGIKLAGGRSLETFLINPQNLNRYTYCLNNPIRYIDPDGLLTVLIPGTKLAPWKEMGFEKDFIKTVRKTFNERHRIAILLWSGKDRHSDRVKGAESLAKYINKYQFAKGEKLNVVGYSHGGNVAFLLSNLELQQKINTMVTLGTPIREYEPSMSNVGEIYNAYSPHDRVQKNLGGGRYNFFGNEWGPAGQVLKEATNIHIAVDRGLIGTHGYLCTKDAWDTYVEKEIQDK